MADPDSSSPWPAPSPLARRANQNLIRPLSDFLHKEASAGILLVLAAVVALVWANSPWSDNSFDLWQRRGECHGASGTGRPAEPPPALRPTGLR